MPNPNNLDLTEDRLFSLGFGLVWKAVCAPSSWSEREGPFNGVNHLPCPDDCNRTHWLVNC